MAYLEWNDTFSVHVREFDEHHKRIVDMINELREVMEQGTDHAGVADMVHNLIDYASIHFRAEERYMAQFGFAGYEAHEAEHDRFIEQVLGFQKRMSIGETVVPDELLRFLKDWLVKHILGTDKQYSQFFNGKGLQ
ncbi:MAG: hemerythrin family protein [Nitrospirae bacterium]|nr:hemerythrin family protein [Nitrospirota bacterium]